MTPDLQDRILVEDGPGGTAALFKAPREIITAQDASSARAALKRLDSARRDGAWIAGIAFYELGFALEPSLSGLLEPDTPLLCFGIFDAPIAAPQPEGTAQVRAVTPLWDRARYAQSFDQIKQMIARGDLYQVNLTMPVEVAFEGTPEALWQAMRQHQPVGHGAFLRLGGHEVLSRSPELFFRTDAQGRISVAPMKGTAPRGDTGPDDDALRDALASDIKNRAENIMIVDLMRNDLSRISRIGSVHVPDLLRVETYATVHQMVSRVSAELDAPFDISRVFEAIFPCGSITGAPKIAAMKAIHRLEGWRRGAYCGAIGWAAPDGRSSFNVAIRTLTLTAPGRALMGIGGGIVHDSLCEAEYEEALWKSRFVTGLIPRSA
ncbi:aminodeoxychorismate synthase component I [Citreicella sp. C3M06]|uniref:aminodeoxychorismate synthase component I n=1 Tax=Citreicella sp. C3M06 TaxID=2841564 RepID=UPI001C08135A|nr:aminodeoxychorismate synthase component I [Citreicella sp. C3M06]MBU2962813.1 aminodeoxychorismate synthase component I [Citreicella sp. C3M06]